MLHSIHSEGGEVLSECVGGSEARWLLRRVSVGAVFYSSSVGDVEEVRRGRRSRFGASGVAWFCSGVLYVCMYRTHRVGRLPAVLLFALFATSLSYMARMVMRGR